MWFFFLAVACIVVQLFAVEYHFNKIVDFDWLKNVSVSELSHLLANNIADATILMIPFVALSARLRKWSWIMIWLFTLWCLAQLLYMPTYRDLMPMSSFLLVDNMGGTVARSTVGAFKIADLEVLLPPILLYLVYRIWFKRQIENTRHSASKRLALSVICLAE